MVPHRRRPAVALVVLAGLALAAIATPGWGAEDRELFGDVPRILAGLSEITGWPVRRPVPAEYISKGQLRGFLEKRIKEEVKPEDIRIEELALKMFGLVPADFDLKKTTLDLLSEQAAAFYDPRKRKLSIIEMPGPENEKRAALVHELAHALADQQFHLERFLRHAGENDDAGTARQAVMEGQATWLMWAYANHEGGSPATVGPASIAAIEGLSSVSSEQYPELKNAPLYLRESLLFPYSKGLRFQDEVFQKLGRRAFSEVFDRPPQSTRHILHPDEYLARRETTTPRLPDLPGRRSYLRLAEGTLGEFDLDILLRQYGSEAEARTVAENWRGGAFSLHEAKRGKAPLLRFATTWASEDAARAFFGAYRTVMTKKWTHYSEAAADAGHVEGTGDRGGFLLRVQGNRVDGIEGIEPPAIN